MKKIYGSVRNMLENVWSKCGQTPYSRNISVTK